MIKTSLIGRRMGGISVQLAHVVPLGSNGRSEGIYWSRFGLAGCVNWVILGRRLAVFPLLVEFIRRLLVGWDLCRASHFHIGVAVDLHRRKGTFETDVLRRL